MFITDCNFLGKASLSCPKDPLTATKFTSFGNGRIRGNPTSEFTAQDKREREFCLVFPLRLENLTKHSEQRLTTDSFDGKHTSRKLRPALNMSTRTSSGRTV